MHAGTIEIISGPIMKGSVKFFGEKGLEAPTLEKFVGVLKKLSNSYSAAHKMLLNAIKYTRGPIETISGLITIGS